MKLTIGRLLAVATIIASIYPTTTLAQPAGAVTPSYALPSDTETIKGRIMSVHHYDVAVRDGRGFVDNVEMHQGTIINPTGLTLAPGMEVSVVGYNRGQTLAATEIDTPYINYRVLFPHPYSLYGPSSDLTLWYGGGGGVRYIR
jgi:hypothetical protein